MAKLGIRQSLKMSQQLMMTPQLQQAIKLLQLSRMELEEYVSTQLEENPLLEEGGSATAEEKNLSDREKEQSASDFQNEEVKQLTTDLADKETKTEGGTEAEDFNWEDFSRVRDQALPSTQAKKSDDAPNYENFISRRESLHESLMTQVSDLDFSPEEKTIAEQIIGNIEDSGYLASELTEIFSPEIYDEDLMEGVLDTIQRMDPPGVAARSLSECLLNQIRFFKLKDGVVEDIVQNHLELLEKQDYAILAKKLGVTKDRIMESIEIIAELEPVPGRPFVSEAPQYIVPDIYVFKMSGRWHVVLNEDGLPRLSVSEMYQDVVEAPSDEGNQEDKEYLNEKMRAATWLIKSIQQRQKTIYKVTQAIVDRQLDFFDKGVEHLKPMILRDIAEDIEMHESNISRVTTNKYVHTPRGIYELKYFFNSSVSTLSGESLASESVKQMIKEIVRVEDQKKPYSDNKIVELLEEKGIQLARRTVAKYREQMNILPSSRRKRKYGA